MELRAASAELATRAKHDGVREVNAKASTKRTVATRGAGLQVELLVGEEAGGDGGVGNSCYMGMVGVWLGYKMGRGAQPSTLASRVYRHGSDMQACKSGKRDWGRLRAQEEVVQQTLTGLGLVVSEESLESDFGWSSSVHVT